MEQHLVGSEERIELFCANSDEFETDRRIDLIFTQVYGDKLIQRYLKKNRPPAMVLMGRPSKGLDYLLEPSIRRDNWATFLGEVFRLRPCSLYAVNCIVDVPLTKYECEGQCFWPLAFCIAILDQVTGPGDLVLDPFMGRGTVGKAASILGRKFIGIDKNPERVKMAEEYIWNS